MSRLRLPTMLSLGGRFHELPPIVTPPAPVRDNPRQRRGTHPRPNPDMHADVSRLRLTRESLAHDLRDLFEQEVMLWIDVESITRRLLNGEHRPASLSYHVSIDRFSECVRSMYALCVCACELLRSNLFSTRPAGVEAVRSRLDRAVHHFTNGQEFTDFFEIATTDFATDVGMARDDVNRESMADTGAAWVGRGRAARASVGLIFEAMLELFVLTVTDWPSSGLPEPLGSTWIEFFRRAAINPNYDAAVHMVVVHVHEVGVEQGLAAPAEEDAPGWHQHSPAALTGFLRAHGRAPFYVELTSPVVVAEFDQGLAEGSRIARGEPPQPAHLRG
jgi:hypothetical protein